MLNEVQPARFDTVALQVFRNLFGSLADEMGIVLQQAAFSANIKVRLDFSCAVFDPAGLLLAQAAHIPVHLGAMGMGMAAVRSRMDLGEGDVVIFNDPFQGGTHLPDISLVSPAWFDGELLGYVMSRAHHADVGGMTPASMPLAREIYQEGLIIPPLKLVESGKLNEDVLNLILRNVRTPDERRGDLLAQLAAQRAGERRFMAIARRYGVGEIAKQAAELMRYSELMTRHFIGSLPRGEFLGEDVMDDDGFGSGPVSLRVRVRVQPEDHLEIDFTETDPQVDGPINATEAVTRSAVLYVLRTLLSRDVPVNAGMLRPATILLRPGSVVCAREAAAVSAGNVETSQRIVDTLYRAFSKAAPDHVPAASQGTMNNLAFGGRVGDNDRPFAYYETLGGGMGARLGIDGMSGVHDHMSNTLNTPVEVLEREYPVRIRRYCLRRRSGGPGAWRGGEGIMREIEFLTPARLTLISERRQVGPYGLLGGENGQPGRNTLIRRGRETSLPGKVIVELEAGDAIRIETPGGGGYGEALPGTPASGGPA